MFPASCASPYIRPWRMHRTCTLREMDYLCPSDEELQAKTDQEILRPLEGATVDNLGGRHPVLIGEFSAEEADEWGAFADRAISIESHCYIDLGRRTVIHSAKCNCIVPSEALADCAQRA